MNSPLATTECKMKGRSIDTVGIPVSNPGLITDHCVRGGDEGLPRGRRVAGGVGMGCKRGESCLRCLAVATHDTKIWFCELDGNVDGVCE